MYNGVSFYIDLSSCAENIFFNKYFAEKTVGTRINGSTGGELWYSNVGGAFYYPDEGTPEYTKNGAEYTGSVNTVPAGFKGTIVVPFVSFIPDMGWSAVDKIFNLKDIQKMDLTFNRSIGGGSFTLKDFKLVANAKVEFTVMRYFQNQDGSYGEGQATVVRTLAGSFWDGSEYAKDQNGLVFDQTASAYLADDPAAYKQESNYFTVNPIIGSDTSEGAAKDFGRGNAIWRYTPKFYYNIAPFSLPETYSLKQPKTTNASFVKIEGDTFTVKKETSNNWTSAIFSDFPTNLTRYNGISFYIDLSNATEDIFFNKYLTESVPMDKNGTPTKEIWYSNYGASMYYPDQGTPEYTKNGAEYSGNINRIPAGFKGRVVTAFVGFTNDWSQVDKVFDLTAIGTIGLTFDRSVGGGSFILKDFKLVSDAKVYISGSAYYQRKDGGYGGSSSIGGRTSFLAGSKFEIQKEVTVNGVEYVIDETLSQYDPNEDASYMEHSFKKNVIVGTENETGDNQYYGMGNATWRYKPTVYYKYKEAFTIEKVFGLDNVKTTVSKGTPSSEILAQFPTGGVTVGNDKGGFSQIKGSWNIESESEDLVVITFTAAVGETAMLDPDGLLRVEVVLATIVPTGITVTAPIKLTYEQGQDLSLMGLVVTLNYSDGSSETVTSGYQVTGYDKTKVGSQIVTVTYEDFTATFTVTVTETQTPTPTPGGSDSSDSSSDSSDSSGSSDIGSSDTGSSDTGSSDTTDSNTGDGSSSKASGGCFSSSVALPLAGLLGLAVVMIKRRKE